MSTTRLLVLGVVAGWGTAHGYAIHNELVSWGADDWAKVRWGSIYHALKQLEREGKLSAAPAPDGSGRIDYSLTDEGREAFLDLVRGALADAGAHADRLAAGLAFLAVLPRAEAVELLGRRLEGLRQQRAAIDPALRDGTARPGRTGHVPELLSLWAYNAESAAAWTEGLIRRLKAGAYVMADDPE